MLHLLSCGGVSATRAEGTPPIRRVDETPAAGSSKTTGGDTTAPRHLAPNMIGRHESVGAVRVALDGLASSGRGELLIVDGATGSGRSRLLDFAAGIGRKKRLRVLRCEVQAYDRARAMTTFDTVIMGLPATSRLRRRLLAGRTDDRLDIVSPVVQALTCLARRTPLVILVDDVDEMDLESAVLLRQLSTATAQEPVLWILTRRCSPATGLVHQVTDEILSRRGRLLTLGPLSNTEIVRLCVDVLQADPGPWLRSLLHGFERPYWIVKLLQSLDREGYLIHHGRQIDLTGPVDSQETTTVPNGFREATGRAAARLRPDCRRLIEVAAVLNRPFSLHDAALLLTTSPSSLIGAAEDAVASGFLADAAEGLGFQHPLIGVALHASLSPTVTRTLHREASEVGQRHGWPAVEVVEHLLRAGEVDTVRVVTTMRRAVNEVAAHSPSVASRIALRLVGFVKHSTSASTGLIADTIRLLVRVGRSDEAREIGEHALQEVEDVKDEALIVRALIDALVVSGSCSTIIEYTRHVLAQEGLSDGMRTELLAEQAHALALSGATEAANGPGQLAMSLGEREGRPMAVALGAIGASLAARGRGDLDEAYRFARKAAETAGPPTARRFPRLWLVPSLAALDRFTEAQAVLTLCRQEALHRGSRWALRLVHLHEAELALASGNLAHAAESAHAGLELSDSVTPCGQLVLLRALISEVEVRRGNLAEAQNQLDQAYDALEAADYEHVGHLAWRRALLLDACAAPESTIRTVTALFAGSRTPSFVAVDCSIGSATMARLALRSSRADAEAIESLVGEFAARNPRHASLRATAEQIRGVIHRDVAALHTAVEISRYSPRPLLRASVLEDAGYAEIRAGGDGSKMLREAEAIWRSTGALHDAERVQRRQRLRSITPVDALPSHPPDDVARDGPGPLTSCDMTPSQERVFELVTQGLTNREVAVKLKVSRHTVDSHLRKIFAKLGVNSRVELTRRFLSVPGDNGARQ